MESLIKRLRKRIERGRPVDRRRRPSLARMIEVDPATTAKELVEFQRFAAQVRQTQWGANPCLPTFVPNSSSATGTYNLPRPLGTSRRCPGPRFELPKPRPD